MMIAWWILLLRLAESELAGESELVRGDIEVVWQVPTRSKGLILGLHGCGHSAKDFWPRSATCPDCLGLPIEMSIVEGALKRDWAFAAVSSVDRRRKCWDGGDLKRLRAVVDYMTTKGVPRKVAAIGASSGGAQASVLTKDNMPGLLGVVVQIMASRNPASTTPVRFVHMVRDTRRAEMIRRQLVDFRRRGVDADEFPVEPRPVTASLFPHLGPDLVNALHDDGFLGPDGLLLQDPRASNWRTTAKKIIPPDVDTLYPDASPVSEILNEAFAFHEFTTRFLDPCLDWLDAFVPSVVLR